VEEDGRRTGLRLAWCGVAQADRCRLLTMETWVRAQGRLHEVYDGQNGTGRGCFRSPGIDAPNSLVYHVTGGV
jgi:hypothetical protein